MRVSNNFDSKQSNCKCTTTTTITHITTITVLLFLIATIIVIVIIYSDPLLGSELRRESKMIDINIRLKTTAKSKVGFEPSFYFNHSIINR